jgi:Lrp/AsnC family transcriptional regulator, leucine-responsive regulatory protein
MAMKSRKIRTIDEFDEKLLRVCGVMATSAELAGKVGLSPSSCQRRQRELEARGFIRGYRAEIDAGVLGQGLTVFAAVQLRRHVRSDVQSFQKAVIELQEVLEVHHIAGTFDYLLRVAVADLASYETFHAERLTALPGVAQITSYVAMSRLK